MKTEFDAEEYSSNCPEDTLLIGRKTGEAAKPGEVYALVGDLGVGKTVFTKGFAQGLGIEEAVSSPTFTILQIYEEGRIPLYHFDVYRIEEPEEMEEVGFDEYIDGDGVCLIEWAGRIAELLPPDVIVVRIEKDLGRGLDFRKITLRRPEKCEQTVEKETNAAKCMKISLHPRPLRGDKPWRPAQDAGK